MKFHHCLFKILKNQNVTDGQQTNGKHEKSIPLPPPPQTQFAGGIMTFVHSEGSDQPGHLHSLPRVLAVHVKR